MIQKDCFTSAWIDSVSKQLKYNDKNLIEKVIRALSLLEMLVEAKCPMVFKGGTSLMLILNDTANRLSIDVDVICPPGTDIEQYLTDYQQHGFTDKVLIERKSRGNDVPKSHSKFYYQIAYKDGSDSPSYILLDVLYEDIHYHQTEPVAIQSPFIQLEGEPLMVTVPSAPDILGDKLTAFAPNTTGIPYFKVNAQGESKDCSLEICKQLFDVGRLFDKVDDLTITSESFKKIAAVELSYRGLPNDLSMVYEDIRQTALCISTRGTAGDGHFPQLQQGVSRLKSFMYKQKYIIDHAIVDAARAAYLATLIEKGVKTIEKYHSPQDAANLQIADTLTNKLNKLRGPLPEAFFYWAKSSGLMQQ